MVRVYTLPQFNITFDYWATGLLPAFDAATYSGVPCQNYYERRVGLVSFSCNVRTPVDLTKQYGVFNFGDPFPVMEVPSGSGRFFLVRQVRVVHEGFPNEYWVLTGTSCTPAGLAIDGHVP